MRTMVANYSPSKALMTVGVILAAIIFIFSITLYSADGLTIAPRGFSLPGALAFQVIAWVCGGLGLLFLALLLWRLVLDRGAAIWLENGRIIHLHRWYQSVDLDDVEDVLTGTFGWFDKPMIVIRKRNGTTIEIPTSSLAEPQEMIVARLKQK